MVLQGSVFPSLLGKGKATQLIWPSVPLDLALSPTLWVTSPHSLLHVIHSSNRNYSGLGCLPAASYLCSFAHPGPLPGMTLPFAQSTLVASPRGRLPWAPPGPSALPMWKSSVYTFPAPPPGHCVPKVLAVKAGRSKSFF